MVVEAPERPVIGCDYSSEYVYLGKIRGTSVLSSQKLWLGKTPAARREAFDTLTKLLHLARTHWTAPDDLFIERPLVNAKFMSPLTGMMMTRSATYIEIAALQAGWTPHFLPVQTWRKTIFGTSKVDKDAAVKYVQGILGYQLPEMGVRKRVPDHNYAEAICIAMAGAILQKEGRAHEFQ